jgi:hypothetical protein
MDARGRCAAFGTAGIENGQTFDRPEAEANRYRYKHTTEGLEGQDEVTEEPHLPTPDKRCLPETSIGLGRKKKTSG